MTSELCPCIYEVQNVQFYVDGQSFCLRIKVMVGRVGFPVCQQMLELLGEGTPDCGLPIEEEQEEE